MLLDYLQQPRAPDFHSQVAHDDTNAPVHKANSPRSIKKQRSFLAPVSSLLRGTVEAVNNAVLQIRDGLTEDERKARAKLDERKQILHSRLLSAQTLEEWKSSARELDVLEDNDSWKAQKDSEDFDAALIEARLKHMDNARISCDVSAMLHLVRTALSRDLGGMGNIKLYKHSHVGTKDLIEQYIDSTLDTIKALVETSKRKLPAGLEAKDILEQVVCARQAFGRSALLLSGGATFGMTHVGVLKSLFEADLLPRIISGASAGSIVCAVLCTRTDEEIPELVKAFPHGDLAVFEDNAKEEGLLERVGRFLTQGAWLDIKHLIRVMKVMLGDMTFQEAYNRTRRILNICVSSASLYELPRLLNYVTSPNVMIWSAVAASCSVPFLFNATHLLVKNPTTGEHLPWNPTPQMWIDGSVDNDLPMTRLAEMFNVNHFIVSQVNPHVIPFLAKDDAAITRATQSPFSASTTATDLMYTVAQLAKGEALHRMQVLADLGIFPNLVTKARSVLSQKYSGDITILPEIDYRDFPRMLKNPTSDFMETACLCGERATWPKLSRVRNHCAIELALDSAVQKLRARVVFSPSQVDLRRMGSSNQAHNPTPTRTASGTRKRRVSSSNALAVAAELNSNDSEDGDLGDMMKMKMARPPIRSVSTAANLNARRPPTITALREFDNTPSLSTSPPTPDSSFDYALPPIIFTSTSRPKLPTLRLSDIISDPDTTAGDRGFASSDADVDSRTDDSSPESETADDHNNTNHDNGNGNTHALFLQHRQNNLTPGPTQSRSNYFSLSTSSLNAPPTPGSLERMNATTPPSAIVGIAGERPALLSPELMMTATRGRGKLVAGKSNNTASKSDDKVGQPSSPERAYKRLFHGNAGGKGV